MTNTWLITFPRNEFRSLIPGAGTGGQVAFLEEQLNHTNSETVYVDFSSASLNIA